MKLEDALGVVEDRAVAACAGAGEVGVSTDTAQMLLQGVAADPREVVAVLAGVMRGIARRLAAGEPASGLVAGALLETFLLGALIGQTTEPEPCAEPKPTVTLDEKPPGYWMGRCGKRVLLADGIDYCYLMVGHAGPHAVES